MALDKRHKRSPRSGDEGGQHTDIATLLQATRFAAEKHRFQRRKGTDASPYINHPIEVADLLANVGGVADLTALVAAVLHDTVEDTETTPEEVEALFGAEVRTLVAEVTDDKSLHKAMRKRLQIEHAPGLSPRAQEIKITDKISNILDITHNPPADWPLERKREYLEWADQVVAGCRGANHGLERRFDEVLKNARRAIGMDRIDSIAGAMEGETY
jgi:guanosine-3',5'-bis(diphosphate) 3'-pyrophosphohydrolase